MEYEDLEIGSVLVIDKRIAYEVIKKWGNDSYDEVMVTDKVIWKSKKQNQDIEVGTEEYFRWSEYKDFINDHEFFLPGKWASTDEKFEKHRKELIDY